MKTRSIRGSLVLATAAILLLSVPRADAALSLFQTVGLDIPDDSAAGLASRVTVDLPGASVTGVTLDLTITPTPGQAAYLGDLYAHLEHAGTLAVLLNRPGRDLQRLGGYDDAQTLDITLADGAPDIHAYRPVPTVSLTGPLVGTFGPDARASDPALALLSDVRSLPLGAFAGLDPAGDWTLFVADLSGGGAHRLVSWRLQIATAPIPEAEVVLGASLLLGWTLWRRVPRRLLRGR